MFDGSDWINEWDKAEMFSLRMGELCAAVPLGGAWEPNDRIALAMASFRLAQMHHSAIHLLLQHDRVPSAYALARPLIEVALRVIWLLKVASDRDVSAILRGRESAVPDLGRLNATLFNKSDGVLTGRHQGLLHSLTHGGGRGMAAQFLEPDVRKRTNAVMLVQAGLALGGAGATIAEVLHYNELLTAFNESAPELD